MYKIVTFTPPPFHIIYLGLVPAVATPEAGILATTSCIQTLRVACPLLSQDAATVGLLALEAGEPCNVRPRWHLRFCIDRTCSRRAASGSR